MKKLALAFLTAFMVINLFAQAETTMNLNKNPRELRPFGIGLSPAYFITAESGILFFNADYFLIPQLALVANLGVTDFEEPYYAAGVKAHLNSNNSTSKFTPFIGALVGYEYYDYMVQIPLGLDYISIRGFNASISMNQLFYFNSFQGTFIDFKIGWRFKS